MDETHTWVEVVVVEDFDCRVRRAPPHEIRFKYYFLDFVASILDYCHVRFRFLERLQELRGTPIDEESPPKVVLLGTPKMPISSERRECLQAWVNHGGVLFVTATERMRPVTLDPLNTLVSTWGFAFHGDLFNPRGEDLPQLTSIIGLGEWRAGDKVMYDTGCSVILPTRTAWSLGEGEGIAGGGVTLSEGGRVAIFGTYWPWTIHGSSGFTAGANGPFLWKILRWLVNQDLTIPLGLSAALQQVHTIRRILPEYFSHLY